jgi:hypothetical protein
MNGMMNIACEGDAEAFVRKAINLMEKEEPSTLQLNVPNDWWAQYCINIFSDEAEAVLPEERKKELEAADETHVDIIFNVASGLDTDFTQLTDEQVQDLIDEFLEDLDEEDDDDDDDDDA